MEGGPTGEELEPLDGGGNEKFDGVDGLSPLSSQYSSCGESEFDRYCSANSVMGTPSVCSSMGFFHDSLDSDFGSLKSLEGFSLGGGGGGRGVRKVEERMVSTKRLGWGRGGGDCLNDGFGGLSDEGECSSSGREVVPVLGSKVGVKVFESEVGKQENLAVLLKNVENVLLQGAVAARSAAENLLECNHADEMEDERCREEDETSSRYEHSDGEDSMFNYGSDDGSQPSAYYVRNVHNKRDEDVGKGSLVLMNPSVAFGSNDWEDFELDGTEESQSNQLPDKFLEWQRSSVENETIPTSKQNFQWHEEEVNERDVKTDSVHLLGRDKLFEPHRTCSTADLHCSELVEAGEKEDTRDSSGACSQLANNDGSDEYLESCSMNNIFEKQCSPVPVQVDTGSSPYVRERENQKTASNKDSCLYDHPVLQQHLDLPPDFRVGEASFPPVDVHRDLRFDVLGGDNVESPVGRGSNSDTSWLESDKGRNCDDLHLSEDNFTTSKGKDAETDAFYDEFVHEMEEILLDSCDSSAMKLKQRYTVFHSEQSLSIRDGGSTASTSGLDEDSSLVQHPLKIDEIEVVGAKQRKGDVSFSERLVGVREYTVYVIRVLSGKDQWEVERRYRDFHTLYRQLKTYFAAQQWALPSPWFSVERESRKYFGNASPNVVAERSTLIQECLSSILQCRFCPSPPSPLIWFLSPPAAILSSSQSNAVVRQSNVGADIERGSTLGKTISLIVDLQSQKSVKELLDKQHYTCAGCHIHFDNGKTRMLEIVQSFGWGKPRFCEYTSQLFCSSCHQNDTAVLPARVLHQWDFTQYPVSQLAKSYLDSIIDKPMLCVSAANPFLFSKVSTLLHIVGVRRKIGAMLPYIRCSFRWSIYKRLGYRKYLLEANDFFALRDLIDLSKGAFAALPAILEAVLKKIQRHITDLCLECCDNGLPCGARQACDNPSSLIFPFQEEIHKCKSCNAVFHKDCFSKIAECPCGLVLKEVDANKALVKLKRGSGVGSSSSLAKNSDVKAPVEFISSLFSISRQEKTNGQREGDNVILMGSLPNSLL